MTTTKKTPMTQVDAHQLYVCEDCNAQGIGYTCSDVMINTSSMFCDHCGQSIYFANDDNHSFDDVTCPYCQKQTSNHFRGFYIL